MFVHYISIKLLCQKSLPLCFFSPFHKFHIGSKSIRVYTIDWNVSELQKPQPLHIRSITCLYLLWSVHYPGSTYCLSLPNSSPNSLHPQILGPSSKLFTTVEEISGWKSKRALVSQYSLENSWGLMGLDQFRSSD